MSEVLERNEAKSLLSLCHAGKLYETERWIAAGNSIRVSAEIGEKPLEVALSLGFHSLAELLLRHEESQEEKNSALAKAVSLRRLDLVELALTHGADLHTVPLENVLLEWNPSIIRLFIDRGADIISGAPFAIAFSEKIRTTLGPFLECKRNHPELVPQLQEQADRALRYFCAQANLKWVSLMLWLGADPRSRGPNMSYWDDEEDPDSFTTALEEASTKGNLEILKKLKPEKDRDDLGALLIRATLCPMKEVVSYLLDIGANPNDKSNGSSSALSRCLLSLGFQDLHSRLNGYKATKWSLHNALSIIEELTSRGAIWVPRDSREMTSVRRELFRCDAEVTIELLSLFTKYRSCSDDTLLSLLKTPRMKEHLSKHEREIARLGLNGILPPKGALVVKSSKTTPAIRRHYISPGLLAKYSREKLYEEVWSQPVQKLAKQYGVSDVALSKVCKKLAVPVPGRGYWAKKIAGRATAKRPPLPELNALA